jgi:hypothetical protein
MKTIFHIVFALTMLAAVFWLQNVFFVAIVGISGVAIAIASGTWKSDSTPYADPDPLRDIRERQTYSPDYEALGGNVFHWHFQDRHHRDPH